ncbi:protein FLUORESCENT IN BLUE LIGHT, chloroplastic-like [Asparagus officinalis]|uniref:protein FLUORESCENT IN BLUE LIGHT, chloroplastic-like n=1 Tax=Asparagus officinalis TaxID=4686 RepID=UPI00098DE7FB|nr:protein FLUORESCENT IN BLUE LIGHT, chloroplastic-like [Asparagus officinalis]
MAVPLRCFRLPPPPPPQGISGGNRTYEYVMILPSRKKKTLMFSSSRSNELKLSKGRLLDMVKFDEALANWKLLFSHISEHQRTAEFSFTKAFVFANTLMIIQPLDALAEVCEADNSLFNMPLLLGVALVGATVGGLLARQRKGELKRLNDQLRQINAALRRQAKIEGYAPNLSYAPVGRVTEEEVIVDPRKQQLLTNLRTGKNYLRNQDPEKAFTEFKVAIELAQDLGDHVEEKKAARGLGLVSFSCRLLFCFYIYSLVYLNSQVIS